MAVDQEYYAGRGFVWSDAVLHAEEITWWDNFGDVPEDMDSDVTYTLEYIGRIVEFCREEEIRLVFVTAPSLDRYLQEIGPYDMAHQYIQELADGYGVPYLDFNLCRDEYLNLGEESYIDVDHLNGYGAETLTRLLARLDGSLEEAPAEAQALIDEYFTAWYDKE